MTVARRKAKRMSKPGMQVLRGSLSCLAVPAVCSNAFSSLCSTGRLCRLVDSLERALHAVSFLRNDRLCVFVCFFAIGALFLVGCMACRRGLLIAAEGVVTCGSQLYKLVDDGAYLID